MLPTQFQKTPLSCRKVGESGSKASLPPKSLPAVETGDFGRAKGVRLGRCGGRRCRRDMETPKTNSPFFPFRKPFKNLGKSQLPGGSMTRTPVKKLIFAGFLKRLKTSEKTSLALLHVKSVQGAKCFCARAYVGWERERRGPRRA